MGGRAAGGGGEEGGAGALKSLPFAPEHKRESFFSRVLMRPHDYDYDGRKVRDLSRNS